MRAIGGFSQANFEIFLTNPQKTDFYGKTGQISQICPVLCSPIYGVKLITSVTQVPFCPTFEHSVIVARSSCPVGL